MSESLHSISEAERARMAHVDELVLGGAAGVPALIALLAEPSWTLRRAAVAGLASLGDDAAVMLCDWLRDRRSSEHEIAAVVDALARSVGRATTALVMELGARGRGAVLEDVGRILGRRRAFEGIPLLRTLLADENDNVAMAAIEALGEIGGSSSVDAIASVLESGNFFRVFPAMQVAARSRDPRVIAPLATLLADETYRFEAALALGRTGSVLALPALEGLLEHPGSEALVAAALAEAVRRGGGVEGGLRGAVRERFAKHAPRFLAAAREGDASSRREAICVLGAVGREQTMAELAAMADEPVLSATVLEAIRILARADDAHVIAGLASQSAIARATVLSVVSGNRTVSSVRACLVDDDADVRVRACETLARIGDTAAVPALFPMLDDANGRVAHAAAAAIQSLGAPPTIGLAITALASPREPVRRHALRILGTLGDLRAFDAVSAAARDPSSRISELAVSALASFDDARVDELLDELSLSTKPPVRAAVMRAAGHRASDRSHAVIERGLRDDDAWVRYYATQAVGVQGDAARTDRVIARLADPSAQVRIAAIDALTLLDTEDARRELLALARASDPDVARAALLGLGHRPDAAALALLLETVTTPDLATRLVGLAGLARSPATSALAGLAAAARDDNPDVRDAALSLLAERDDAAAAGLLVELALEHDDAHPASAALTRAGGARIAEIERRLGTARDGEVSRLVALLACTPDDSARVALFAALAHPNPDVRRDAIAALVSIDAEGAAEAARRMAAHDPDLEVRRVGAAASAAAVR